MNAKKSRNKKMQNKNSMRSTKPKVFFKSKKFLLIGGLFAASFLTTGGFWSYSLQKDKNVELNVDNPTEKIHMPLNLYPPATARPSVAQVTPVSQTIPVDQQISYVAPLGWKQRPMPDSPERLEPDNSLGKVFISPDAIAAEGPAAPGDLTPLQIVIPNLKSGVFMGFARIPTPEKVTIKVLEEQQKQAIEEGIVTRTSVGGYPALAYINLYNRIYSVPFGNHMWSFAVYMPSTSDEDAQAAFTKYQPEIEQFINSIEFK